MDFALSLEDISVEKLKQLRVSIVSSSASDGSESDLSSSSAQLENELKIEVVLLAIELLIALIRRKFSNPDLFRKAVGGCKLPALIRESNIIDVVAILQDALSSETIEDDVLGMQNLTDDFEGLALVADANDAKDSKGSSTKFSVPLSPISDFSKLDNIGEDTFPTKTPSKSQLFWSPPHIDAVTPKRPRSAPKRDGLCQSCSPSKLYHYSVSSELDWKRQLRSSSTCRSRQNIYTRKTRARTRSKSLPTPKLRLNNKKLSSRSPVNLCNSVYTLPKSGVVKHWR